MTDNEIIKAWEKVCATGDAPFGKHWGCSITTELAKNTLDTLVEQKADIERLNNALALALKFNSNLEADKKLANVELDRLNSEVARLTSDCKTLSAVLSREVEPEKEAVMAFVGFLEEHAKTEVFKRCGLDLEIKFVYIGDVKELAEEFLRGG